MWNKSLPLYKRVANQIKEDIVSYGLTGGDMIPSEQKIADTYNVSRVTVRQAIKLLTEKDILYSVQGSGTYIKGQKIEYDIFNVQSFTAEMSEMNKNFINKILNFQLKTPSPYIQEILDLSEDDKIFFVERLRYTNNEPYILEESYLPASIFPDLSIEVMENSLYEYIKDKNLTIKERKSEISPTMPNENTKKLLRLEDDVPILIMNNLSMFQDTTKFEYTKIYFNPNKYTFKFNINY
ncbi:GntR family transcriptional regulator [Mammaliicoccus lentus]|jgi:GntR family mannosyl-D-glycerate transport/metabolism transcriptional repressor|uniref:GntR family transcriptional regulator n=1 Tax=Mammaliicoccus lentus TaxID=42858 RepID=A0ABS6GXP1_MAMLE|nr:GntR family transcriptional regulator [Mammaliicoccus lentus]MBU6113437.1 GntR family transcriptional regulator [Mammaliicoccus lentus]